MKLASTLARGAAHWGDTTVRRVYEAMLILGGLVVAGAIAELVLRPRGK